MIDFEKLDKEYVVKYDERKTCRFAYIWSKKDFPKKPSKKRFISVSEAFEKVKEHKWHFYPAGHYVDTYLVAYDLNEELGTCTNDWGSLYFIGKKNGKPWEYVKSVGNAVDINVDYLNRDYKIANYLLGYLNDDDLNDSDSFYGTKKDLISTLKRCLEKYSNFS